MGRARSRSDSTFDKERSPNTIKKGVEAVVLGDVEAPAPGYLSIQKGARVEVLHIGDEANAAENGWVFARVVDAQEQGWLQREVWALRHKRSSPPHCGPPRRACPQEDGLVEHANAHGNPQEDGSVEQP